MGHRAREDRAAGQRRQRRSLGRTNWRRGRERDGRRGRGRCSRGGLLDAKTRTGRCRPRHDDPGRVMTDRRCRRRFGRLRQRDGESGRQGPGLVVFRSARDDIHARERFVTRHGQRACHLLDLGTRHHGRRATKGLLAARVLEHRQRCRRQPLHERHALPLARTGIRRGRWGAGRPSVGGAAEARWPRSPPLPRTSGSHAPRGADPGDPPRAPSGPRRPRAPGLRACSRPRSSTAP